MYHIHVNHYCSTTVHIPVSAFSRSASASCVYHFSKVHMYVLLQNESFNDHRQQAKHPQLLQVPLPSVFPSLHCISTPCKSTGFFSFSKFGQGLCSIRRSTRLGCTKRHRQRLRSRWRSIVSATLGRRSSTRLLFLWPTVHSSTMTCK